MSASLSERDMAQAIAFVDGQLDEAARASFEERMYADPELERAVEQLIAGEEVLERWRRGHLARPASRPRPTRFGPRVALAAVFALAAGVALSYWLWPEPPASGARLELAVVAGHDSFAQFRELHPSVADIISSSLDGRSRGPAGQAAETPPAEALGRVRALEAELGMAALAQGVQRIESEKFFATVRLREPASVLVVACSRTGEAADARSPWEGPLRLLFPDPRCDDEELARRLEQTRLGAGVHQLPGSVVKEEDGELRFASAAPEVFNCRPGKDPELAVLVAVTPASVDLARLRELQSQLAAGLPATHEDRLQQLRQRLTSAGFTVGEFTVVNPRAR